MKKFFNHFEKGQVLVILVIGITALLAFTALAIDGGMYFSDRRYDQNAADDSALSGAGAAADSMNAGGVNYSNFTCTIDEDDPVWQSIEAAMDAAIAKAQAQAVVNNFTIANNLDTQHGATATCVIEDRVYDKKYIRVTVMVTSIVKSGFAHMIFGGELRNTVEAVSEVEPSEGVGKGMAIVALNDNCQGGNDGLKFSGNSLVVITSSGAHSNDCFGSCGSATVDATGGSMNYLGELKACHKDDTINPDPVQINQPIDRYQVNIDCSTLVGKKQGGGNNITLEPGIYDQIVSGPKDNFTFRPGLYCVRELDFKGENITVASATPDPNEDDGVTFYILPSTYPIPSNLGKSWKGNGSISINASTSTNLRAPRKHTEPGLEGTMPPNTPPAVLGMLIYMDPTVTATITLNGNSSTSFRGTVYAPYGNVKINGNNSSANYDMQLIANNVEILGSTDVNIQFDNDDVYWGNSFLGLFK